MRHHYILKGRTPVKATFEEWARFFENADRQVASDLIGGVQISTVFLGLDHRFSGQGPPLLFETMIFDGAGDNYQTRCSTWEQAEAMHGRAVELAKSGMKLADLALHMARGQPPLA